VADAPPNILLVICHDLGQHIGCYGWPVDTPNLCRLAAEGVRFDEYFATAPQCSPSRASILTGQYPHACGVMGLVGGGWELPDAADTLPKALRSSGYETWLWGFQHENADRPAALGYDHDPIGFCRGEVPKILARNVTPPLCQWLRSRPREPFFASVGFFETHIPFSKRPLGPGALERIRPLPYLPDHPAIRQDLAELYNDVREVDRRVGEVLDALDDAGLAERTVVLFTTDHGIAFPRAKCSLYDPGTKTALLLRWPGRVGENRVISELLSNVDLMPTLLDLAAVPAPAGLQGRSFAGLLCGGEYRPREEVFCELTWHTEYDPTRAIRTGRHKFIRHWDPPPGNLQPKDYWDCCAGSEILSGRFAARWPQRELYDLAADPHEQHNLIGQHGFADLAERLEARLLDWMAATGDPLLAGPVPGQAWHP